MTPKMSHASRTPPATFTIHVRAIGRMSTRQFFKRWAPLTRGVNFEGPALLVEPDAARLRTRPKPGGSAFGHGTTLHRLGRQRVGTHQRPMIAGLSPQSQGKVVLWKHTTGLKTSVTDTADKITCRLLAGPGGFPPRGAQFRVAAPRPAVLVLPASFVTH